jgi:hypothetical protein
LSYCIDTNCLIDLENLYPSDIFSALWDSINEIVGKKDIFSVKDVFKELKETHDDEDPVLQRWKVQDGFFVESGNAELELLTKIMNDSQFEVFRNHAPDKGTWADPHLIACAESRNAIVVTNETLNNKPQRKIPYVCEAVNVDYLSLLNMMRHLNWTF